MLYSVLFRFGHIRRSDQCAVYILYSKISTDPGLPLKIRHSHRFVAVVIQFLIPLILLTTVWRFCVNFWVIFGRFGIEIFFSKDILN